MQGEQQHGVLPGVHDAEVEHEVAGHRLAAGGGDAVEVGVAAGAVVPEEAGAGPGVVPQHARRRVQQQAPGAGALHNVLRGHGGELDPRPRQRRPVVVAELLAVRARARERALHAAGVHLEVADVGRVPDARAEVLCPAGEGHEHVLEARDELRRPVVGLLEHVEVRRRVLPGGGAGPAHAGVGRDPRPRQAPRGVRERAREGHGPVATQPERIVAEVDADAALRQHPRAPRRAAPELAAQRQ